MAWTLLQYEIFQQLELWHEKESVLCHRNGKYWSSLENQLARLRSIIHHPSHHEMTYFALYLFSLLSHFTTLPHLTSDWISVLWRLPAPAPDWAPSVGAGSGLDCDKQQARPTLGENRPKLQSQWRHLYPILLQSPSSVSYLIHDAWLCVGTY